MEKVRRHSMSWVSCLVRDREMMPMVRGESEESRSVNAASKGKSSTVLFIWFNCQRKESKIILLGFVSSIQPTILALHSPLVNSVVFGGQGINCLRIKKELLTYFN